MTDRRRTAHENPQSRDGVGRRGGRSGTAELAASKAHKAPRHDRTGQTIFPEEAPADLTRTKVLKVGVVQELSDLLVFDVEYNRTADYEGELVLTATPDIPQTWNTQTLLQRGKNIVSVELGLEDEAKESTVSNNLSFSIEHYKDRKYLGSTYRRTVPFEKQWASRLRRRAEFHRSS